MLQTVTLRLLIAVSHWRVRVVLLTDILNINIYDVCVVVLRVSAVQWGRLANVLKHFVLLYTPAGPAQV